MKDVIIIGGGPAGFSAAIYAVRSGLSVQILEKTAWGGQASITPEIENYPGLRKISGAEFAMMLYEQAKELGVQVDNYEVNKVELNGSVKKLYTKEEVFEGRAVVIASGLRRRKLNCPGEDEYAGKGVSYCATCDGAFFRGKTVVMVGGGNTALEDALFLSNHCEKVFLVQRRDAFRADEILVQRVKERENITIKYDSIVKEIAGDGIVQEVTLENVKTGEKEPCKVQGVFIAIGYEPDSGMYEGQLELTEKGYFISDENCTTCLPGVFVAGDCREKKLRQIITAASDGAIAGFGAAAYVSTLK